MSSEYDYKKKLEQLLETIKKQRQEEKQKQKDDIKNYIKEVKSITNKNKNYFDGFTPHYTDASPPDVQSFASLPEMIKFGSIKKMFKEFKAGTLTNEKINKLSNDVYYELLYYAKKEFSDAYSVVYDYTNIEIFTYEIYDVKGVMIGKLFLDENMIPAVIPNINVYSQRMN